MATQPPYLPDLAPTDCYTSRTTFRLYRANKSRSIEGHVPEKSFSDCFESRQIRRHKWKRQNWFGIISKDFLLFMQIHLILGSLSRYSDGLVLLLFLLNARKINIMKKYSTLFIYVSKKTNFIRKIRFSIANAKIILNTTGLKSTILKLFDHLA